MLSRLRLAIRSRHDGRSWLNFLATLVLFTVVLAIAAVVAMGLALPDGFRSSSRVLEYAYGLALYFGWFRLETGIISLIAAAMLFALARPRLCIAALIIGLVVIMPPLRTFLPASTHSQAGNPGKALKLTSINIEGGNRDVQRTLAAIRTADPDILLIQECTPFHITALTDAFAGDYPHRLTYPDEVFDGMAIYSRIPIRLESAPVIVRGSWPSRILKTTLTLDGREIGLWNVHLMAVSNLDQIARNRAETADLIDNIRAQTRPLIVAGDFNFTIDTPNSLAIERAGMRESNILVGSGIAATWHPDGWLHFLGTRIDHVYFTSQFACTSDRVGPEIGSDHRPISVTITQTREPLLSR